MDSIDSDFRFFGEVPAVFSESSLSDRQYFVPDGICRTFEIPAETYGPGQKDATEFFGEFFEKLDDALKKIESKWTKMSHTAPS